jgi:hypothetical protein
MTKSSGAISQTTNDKDIDNRIQELSNRLKVLNIEKASTKQQLRELENEKAERKTGRLRRNIDRARRRQSEADRKSRQAARDRKGELIVLGDRVRFLTKGFIDPQKEWSRTSTREELALGTTLGTQSVEPLTTSKSFLRAKIVMQTVA